MSLSDTPAASPAAPLSQLNNIASKKERVTAARLPSRHDSHQHDIDDDDTRWLIPAATITMTGLRQVHKPPFLLKTLMRIRLM